MTILESMDARSAQTSLFDRIGGMRALNQAVDIFYDKVVEDPLTRPFFSNVSMSRQRAKLKAFLVMALGGPSVYTGRNLRDAHRPLVQRGLNDDHMDRVIAILGETLRALGVSHDDIKEVAAIANSVRDDILDR